METCQSSFAGTGSESSRTKTDGVEPDKEPRVAITILLLSSKEIRDIDSILNQYLYSMVLSSSLVSDFIESYAHE